MDTVSDPPFRHALRRVIAACGGSQVELERRSGVPQQTISWLLLKAPKVSPEHAVAFERASGGEVDRAEFRPDIFRREPAEPQPEAAA